MTWVRQKNIGLKGVIKDLSEHELQNDVFTSACNIRFLDGSIRQVLGFKRVYCEPLFNPIHILPCRVGDQIHWIYASRDSVGVASYNGSGNCQHFDITKFKTKWNDDGQKWDNDACTWESNECDRYSYLAKCNSWTSTLLGGVPILNDGSKQTPPQMWSLQLNEKLIDLPGWQEGVACGVIRSFKNFLIALDVKKVSADYPFMVKWSHPADAGSVPISWDETNPIYDAGEVDLSEGYDKIIDGLTLRDVFMIYKEHSVYRMSYIGAPYIFSFDKVLGASGAMNKNCIVEIDGYHLVLTNQDVIIHDGYTATSILDKEARRFLFDDMDARTCGMAFVAKNPYFNEALIFYPSISGVCCNKKIDIDLYDNEMFDAKKSDVCTVQDDDQAWDDDSNQWNDDGNPWDKTLSGCNKVLVYNYKDKTVSFRDAPMVCHASYGIVDDYSIGTNWNNDVEAWDSDSDAWNDTPKCGSGTSNNGFGFVPNTARVIMTSSKGHLYLLDGDYLNDGEMPSAHIERVGLSFGKPEKIKLIRSLRLRTQGDNTKTIKVIVGYHDDPYQPVIWCSESTHTIGSTVSCDCLVSGRYLAYRIESNDAKEWRLDSIDFDIQERGEW